MHLRYERRIEIKDDSQGLIQWELAGGADLGGDFRSLVLISCRDAESVVGYATEDQGRDRLEIQLGAIRVWVLLKTAAKGDHLESKCRFSVRGPSSGSFPKSRAQGNEEEPAEDLCGSSQ